MKDVTTVTTAEGLRNAAQARYLEIHIEGDFANKIASRYRYNKDVNDLSDVSILGGLLFSWPFLVVGLAGKFLSKDLNRYYIKSCSDDEVVLGLKERYIKKKKK